MLVLCAGMYRACSTWQYEVVRELLRRRDPVQALGYLTGPEFAAARVSGKIARDGWAVVKSHEPFPDFTRLCRSQEAIVIYAHRDVRDVAYSLMHKMGVDFPGLLRLGMIHQVLANDRYWRARPRILVQRYDALTADPVSGIEGLAGFLGLSLLPGEADELAEQFSPEANRRRASRLAERLRDRGVDLADPANGMIYDAGSLLHWNHLRDGRNGGWRTRATPEERTVLNRIAGNWLEINGYEPDRDVGAPFSRRERAEMARACRRGALACALRCAGLRYPRLGNVVKGLLRWEAPGRAAVPASHLESPRVGRAEEPAAREVVTADLDRGRKLG